MHTVFFGIKKVHWRVVGITNRLVRRAGMTAARFDLMRIILLAPAEVGVAQGTLRWLLGVAAPTASRMLKSLEVIGYVERDRSVDRRCRTVRLTPLGRQMTEECVATYVESARADCMAARGVLGDTKRAGAEEGRDEIAKSLHAGREKLDQLRGLLGKMRRVFADTAPYPHPWRMGNFLPPLVHATFDEHGNMTIRDAFTGAPA